MHKHKVKPKQVHFDDFRIGLQKIVEQGDRDDYYVGKLADPRSAQKLAQGATHVPSASLLKPSSALMESSHSHKSEPQQAPYLQANAKYSTQTPPVYRSKDKNATFSNFATPAFMSKFSDPVMRFKNGPNDTPESARNFYSSAVPYRATLPTIASHRVTESDMRTRSNNTFRGSDGNERKDQGLNENLVSILGSHAKSSLNMRGTDEAYHSAR